MKGFTIFHNGRRVCTAGVGERDVLSIILSCMNESRSGENQPFHLHVGAYDGAQGRMVEWEVPDIWLGEEITIRLVEVRKCDPPARSRSVTGPGAAG